MSKRLEAERHLQALDEIRHIMGSMKTLAQLETRKLGRFLATQQQALRNIEAMAADFCSFYAMTPPLAPDARHIYLLLGSERGFCGDFNEAVLHALDEAPGDAEPRLVAVGRKLSLRLEDDSRLIQALDGPDAAEEVEAVLARLVEELGRLQERDGSYRLTVVAHAADAGEVQRVPLLPPFPPGPEAPRYGYAPRLNLPPQAFYAELLDQYLFASLYGWLYTSLMAENLRRMQHLEGAIHRLEEQSQALALRRNTLRQEEITEEIEVILLSAKAVQQG